MPLFRAFSLRMFVPSISRCEDSDRRSVASSCKAPGIVFVTNGVSREVKSLIWHLHLAGIHHATEVRMAKNRPGNRDCQRDRRVHKYVEEMLNGSWAQINLKSDFEYRCVDVLEDETIIDDPAYARSVVAKVLRLDVNFLGAIPESSEKFIPFADRLSDALPEPIVANGSTTSSLRIDKFDMQEAVRAAGLDAPMQCKVSVDDDALECMRSSGLRYPVVVKPVSSGASEGVVLCRDDEDLESAIYDNFVARDMFDRLKTHVTIQEYLQGKEFVVNTVSLKGHHRVVDMWSVAKHAQGNQIFYDHQWFVQDSREYPHVVDYAMKVLDAVGFAGGPAHIELVQTDAGMHLLEVNPRAAGHAPRAGRQVHEDQLSAFAKALADPEAFIKQASDSPHYRTSSETATDILVVFLRAGQDAEVHRDCLLKVMNLPGFWRFDRVGQPMFANSVESADEDSFWLAARTTDLFNVPLTVLFKGIDADLSKALETIRLLEKDMYKPFGTHEVSGYMGCLAGADPGRWFQAAYKRAFVPSIGTRVRVRPGFQFQGAAGNLDHYTQNDLGTVSKHTKEQIWVTWDRTGLQTGSGKLAWSKSLEVESIGPEVPEIGCRVQTFPGRRLQPEDGDGVHDIFQPSDVGVVTAVMDGRVHVEWRRTGRSSSTDQSRWAEEFRIVPPIAAVAGNGSSESNVQNKDSKMEDSGSDTQAAARSGR